MAILHDTWLVGRLGAWRPAHYLHLHINLSLLSNRMEIRREISGKIRPGAPARTDRTPPATGTATAHRE